MAAAPADLSNAQISVRESKSSLSLPPPLSIFNPFPPRPSPADSTRHRNKEKEKGGASRPPSLSLSPLSGRGGPRSRHSPIPSPSTRCSPRSSSPGTPNFCSRSWNSCFSKSNRNFSSWFNPSCVLPLDRAAKVSIDTSVASSFLLVPHLPRYHRPNSSLFAAVGFFAFLFGFSGRCEIEYFRILLFKIDRVGKISLLRLSSLIKHIYFMKPYWPIITIY